MSNSWLIYVGVLFIAMVIFAPTGLAGLILAHRPIARARKLHRLAVPYLRLLLPGLATVAGFVGLVELASFLTIGEAQGKHLTLFGGPIDAARAEPWLITGALLLLGGAWLTREAGVFRRVWESLTAEAMGAS
jgi:branched-chain amino acid transport system permease protein